MTNVTPSAAQPTIEAVRLFETLKGGSSSQRAAAGAQVQSNEPPYDRVQLRGWLLGALRGDFDTERAAPGRDWRKATTRGWLLNALAICEDQDDEARNYVRDQLDPNKEENPWSRHWTLDGMIRSQAADLLPRAQRLCEDPAPLVAMLARAVLARNDDLAPRKVLLEALGGSTGDEAREASLRALRLIPLPPAVDPLSRIASEEKMTNWTYDAIYALSQVPGDWPEASKAARALQQCVENCRRHPWWDSLRAKAIRGLGDLHATEAAPMLVEEIAAENPSIVFESACALERVAGTSTATDRIVEAACVNDAVSAQHYANAFRWIDRRVAVDRLEQLMLTGTAAQQDVAQALLREVGGEAAFQKLRARTESMKRYEQALQGTESKLQETFTSTLTEARHGYRISTRMDVTVFVLGIALVVFSLYQIVSGKLDFVWFTGSGGALAVLYSLFFANPRTRIVEAVDHLMSLKVLFLGYLRQLHQTDQAYIRRLLDDEKLTPETVTKFGQLVAGTMKTRHRCPREPHLISAAPLASPATLAKCGERHRDLDNQNRARRHGTCRHHARRRTTWPLATELEDEVARRRFVDPLNAKHYHAVYLPLSTVPVLDGHPQNNLKGYTPDT